MTKLTKRKLICVAIIIVGIIVDFASKRILSGAMTLHQSIPLWQDVLHITLVHNYGAAFGMMSGSRWIFITVSTVAIIAFCAYLVFTKSKRPLWLYALAMMASGGIGNMIDRIWLGYVVDFIDFTLIDFAVFNIADSLICVGAGLMMLDLILDMIATAKQVKLENEQKRKAAEAALCELENAIKADDAAQSEPLAEDRDNDSDSIAD